MMNNAARLLGRHFAAYQDFLPVRQKKVTGRRTSLFVMNAQALLGISVFLTVSPSFIKPSLP